MKRTSSDIDDRCIDFDYRVSISSKYRADLKKVWVDSPTNFVAWWDDDSIYTLDCKAIDQSNKPPRIFKGFEISVRPQRERFP